MKRQSGVRKGFSLGSGPSVAAVFLLTAACTAATSSGPSVAQVPVADVCPAPGETVAGRTLVAQPFEVSVEGLDLNSVFTAPQDVAPRAVVVLMHGYQGSRDEIAMRGGEGMFQHTAKTLASYGIASVRFDFRGSGKSGGAWADTSFAGQARDAQRVIEAVRATPGYASVPLHVLGFSQGGLIALDVAGADVASLTLWNPVMNPEQTYGRIFGPGNVTKGVELAKAGDLSAPVAGTGLNAGFFAGIDAADPPGWAKSYPGPLLIAAGKRDKLAGNGPALAEAAKAARGGETRVLSVDAGHALGAARGAATIDSVIACTAGFILRHSGVRAQPEAASLPALQ